ncbi:MAG TPA: condensation domain-containing protein, partial [Pyrinomonadaceae bacterium]|nr:condensation domain-containing protein [Pyrinomonadaceae bacterium]
GLEGLRWLVTDGGEGGARAGDWREPSVTPETLAFLQYTSGSTGDPKGVMVTHGNVLHNSALIAHGFRYTPATECVTWLPLYHDMGLIGGVLQPLYGGFTNTLLSPLSFVRNPFGWLKTISAYGADLSGAPNFAYELCARRVTDEQRAALDLRSWEVAFVGAEPIRRATLERFAAAFAPCGFRREAFLPCYGLAEATLIVSCGTRGAGPSTHAADRAALEQHRVLDAAAEADAGLFNGCGKPLPSQQVALVNPETRALCRPDEVGEVWVSGPSVARGYWGRPEETAATFDARLADTGEGPFLRTGDLGYLRGGELFISGRLDDLMIIRGRNHYPQDIEQTVERSHPALRPHAGAAFLVESADEEQLVVVQELERRRHAEPRAVIEAVRLAVADAHGVQPHAVVLVGPGAVPKTSSGKIRRKACRAKYLEGGLAAVAEWREADAAADGAPAPNVAARPESREAVESFVVSQLAARLRVPPSSIDVNRPLTEYGLDSLNAVELAHALEKSLGLTLPAASILEGRSVAELAAQTPRAASRLSPPADAADDAAPLPLSHGQRSLWFLHQLAPESAAYNIPVAARVLSEVDADALRRAFSALARRHPSLRATFTLDGGEPAQRVRDGAEISFRQVDAARLSEAALRERLAEEAHAPFDLERGPLMRVSLYTRAEDEHLLLLVVHHIVADFWSLAVLVEELGRLYEAERGGPATPPPPPAFRYADYVRWQDAMLRGAEGERLRAYWLEKLSGGLPVLNLPTDRPRPPLQTFRGARVPLRLDAALTRRLKTLGRERGATLYMTLLAGLQALLHRHTGQKDFLVGSPTSGRNRADFEGVVGYFINPVVVRADLSRDPTFEELLGRVRRTVLEAFEHQDYPLALLVEQLQPERAGGRSAIFDVAFVFQKSRSAGDDLSPLALGEGGAKVKVGGLELESVALDQRASQFDLTLLAAEVGEELALSLQYNADLFNQSTIERLAGHLRTLLDAATRDPSRHVSRLPLLTDAERRRLLVEFNDTAREYPRGDTIHSLFGEQARRTPDAVALACGEAQLTYRELDERSNQLARYLRALGVGPETLVGICMGRTPELVCALLGVLKAGGAYVPLDPDYPAQRLGWMLSDSDAALVLTQAGAAARLRESEPGRARLVFVEEAGDEIGGQSAEAVESLASPDNLAYVIYTSGSTGRPKGVAIAHRSAACFLRWAADSFTPAELSGVLASTSVCFDLSVFELFAPLAWGGAVILAASALSLPELPPAQSAAVTLVNTVPSAMAELVRAGSVPDSV